MLQATQHDSVRRKNETESLLRYFKLEHVRNVRAAKISGGEGRCCEIARTLAAHPSFILLDEPFAKLDPIAIGEVRSLVRSLKEMGIGILITDHNLSETLRSVDRAYVLYAGKILAEGSPEIIAGHPDCRRFYSGWDH